MSSKACTKCGETKALEEFPPNKRMRDGRASWCRTCYASAHRRWRERNPEKLRESGREKSARYRQRNTSAAVARNRRWRDENPAKARLSQRQRSERRRALKASIPDQLPAWAWERILRRSGGRCGYCSKVVGVGALTMDHVVPLSRGGAHSVGNVVPACGPCNYSKGPKLLVEWKRSRPLADANDTISQSRAA